MMVYTLKNVNIGYGSKTVVKNIDLQIPQGKFVIIVGPNGAGKTTLLRGLASVLPYHLGEINLYEQSLNSFSAKALSKKIAYVERCTDDQINTNVLQMVLLGRFTHLPWYGFETSQDISIAKEALELMGLIHYQNSPFNNLSSGEKQRVLIARALAQRSPVILLDEPLSNVDIPHQVSIYRILKNLALQKKITLIVTSHELNLDLQYADVIVMLKKGEIYKIITDKSDFYDPSLWSYLYDYPMKQMSCIEGPVKEKSDTRQIILPAD